ncbi:MAG: hypothetical protein RMJ44_10600 [Cytophagales bacterium]|nr:hypothetical protein [Bernardetiaceae bacterium]MDW8211523.1 hypothetical protein [Cytophagales bacterium]
MIVLVVLFKIFCSYWLHPIHISLCEIRFNPSSKQLEITHKIFIDDLENALEHHYQLRTYLATAKEHPDSEKLIERYLRQRFECTANNKPVQWKYLGREYELDAIWIYLEAEQESPLQSIEVRNSVLLELFDDQINFIQVDSSGERKNLRLGRHQEKGWLYF